MCPDDLDATRIEREARARLVVERRNYTISQLGEVLGCYKRKVHTEISRPVELAYWSAYSALVVNRCFEAVERNASFSERCELRDQAIQLHKLRALVYWQSMNEVYQYAHTRAPRREGVEEEDRERTYVMALTAGVQIRRISADFSLINLQLLPGKEPLKIFREIVNGYPKVDNIPTRDSLAYWNARDALTVNDCFLALGSNADMREMVRLDDLAYDSHHRRSLAYWEAVHRFDSDNYGDLIREGSGDGLKKLLWNRFEQSHSKVSMLEDELSLLNSGTIIPRELDPKHFGESEDFE